MDELELTVDQAESEKAETEEPEIALATVGDITENGVKLKFDGADSYSEKEYKCNTGIMIRTGDRVKVSKISGTYIVEYVVGSPMADYPIPVGTEGQFFTNADGSRTGEWSDVNFMEKPDNDGSNGQVLTKTVYSYKWAAAPTELPSSGTTGYYLKKTSSGVEWAAAPTELPSSGTTGYYLQKTASGTQWAAAPTELPSTGTANYFLQKTASGVQWASVTQYDGPTIKGSGTTSLGFFGVSTAATQQSLSTTTNNQGYTSATASNYLYILNNIAGILRKLGLIKSY